MFIQILFFCVLLMYRSLRVVGHVVAMGEKYVFYWGDIKKTLCTSSIKPENITILKKRLTFLLRTTAPTASSTRKLTP